MKSSVSAVHNAPLVILATLLLLFNAAVADRMVVTYEPGTGQQVLNDLKKQGWTLAVDIPEGNSFTLTRPASKSRGAVVSELSGVRGVTAAQPDGKIYLQSTCHGVDNTVFAASDGSTETLPWGIKKVQADDPTLLTGNKPENVIFCILDTGVDATHPDLSAPGNTLKGCSPPECPHNWDKDSLGHGTHIAGTIAARRTGKGVLGVMSSGAHVYAINIFGDAAVMNESDLVSAWDSCVNYLKSVKASKPNTKMVINMSIGGPGPANPAISAKVDSLYKRGDILFFSAAGNAGTTAVAYPGGYPNVVAVAAVDQDNNVPAFSQKNSDVEIAAPGVGVLSSSTVAKSTITIASDALIVNPAVAASSFGPTAVKGSSGTASGTLVDCGDGQKTCSAASGAICLVRLGGDMCSQVTNCKAGGGVGIIFVNTNGDECSAMVSGSIETCPFPAAAVSRAYAESLIAAGVTATVNGNAKPQSYALKTGTSMATPHVSGVAGLLWSFYPKCSNSEVRKALVATAAPVNGSGAGAGLAQAKAAVDYLKTHPCTGAVTALNSSDTTKSLKLSRKMI